MRLYHIRQIYRTKRDGTLRLALVPEKEKFRHDLIFYDFLKNEGMKY